MYVKFVHNVRADDGPDRMVNPFESPVRVDRTTKWGNPFKIAPGSDREAAVRLYAHWIFNESMGAPTVAEIRSELRGRDLECWCAPALCHAHVLACIANEEDGLERVVCWADADPGQ